MASLTGLTSGDFTDIDVLYTINLDGSAGSDGQVISSDGANSNWVDPHTLLDLEDLTSGTGIAYDSGSTYDGSVARTITTSNVPNSALSNSTISGKALGTNLDNLTAGTNISFNTGSTYNGSSAITISSTDTNTTYTAGDGLDLTGTTFSADLKSGSGLVITSTEIDLEDIPNSALDNSTITIGSTAIALGATSTTVSGLTGLSFLGAPGATTLTGNNYTDTQTTTTYLDLTSATNVLPTLYPNYVSPYLAHTSYDPASSTPKSLTTSYSTMYSPYLLTTFVARGASVEVQIQTYNYAISSNRWLYLRLVDDDDAEWSGGDVGDGGGKDTTTRTTERTIHYSDETDKQPINFTWVLTGLSAGTEYIVNPQAKTNSTTNYLYAGGSYAPNIIKIIQI